MKISQVLVVTLSLALMTGCSPWWVKKNDLDNRQMRQVASDFSRVIAQVRGKAPIRTTLSLKKPESEFGEVLYDSLREAGYGVRFVTRPEGKNYVDYASDRFERNDHTKVAYRVEVGQVKLSREYELQAGKIYPTSAMSIEGGEAINPIIDDQPIFKRQSNLVPAPIVAQTPNIQGVVKVTDQEKVVTTEVVKPIVNMNKIGKSNYADLFEQYHDVSVSRIYFDNDSAVLRTDGDAILRRIMTKFSPDTDIISIIGCSHGKTNIKNGNAYLATGRSDVVKQFLVKEGIPFEAIMPESCWAPYYVDSLPKRGVEVTLKRKRS